MEADFRLAKRLGMNQGTLGTRFFAQWSIPPWQGLHAFVNHQRFGDYTSRLIQSPLDLTMLPEAADESKSRNSLKVHHFAFIFFPTGNTPNGRNSILILNQSI